MQRDPSLFNLPVPTFEPPTTAGSEKRWVDAVQSTLPAANGRTTTDVHSRDIEIADPHEVAFLRGGEIEVMRLYLFDLVQRGYLEVIETRKWLTTERRLAVSRNPPPYDALTGTERAILNWFAPLMTIDEALKLHTREPVKSVCDRYREQLEANGQFEVFARAGAEDSGLCGRLGRLLHARRRRMADSRNRDGGCRQHRGTNVLPPAVAKRKGTAG